MSGNSFPVQPVLHRVDLVFGISVILVDAVFGVAALFKELHRHRTELGVTQHIFRLFSPFGTFLFQGLQFRLEQVGGTAGNGFFVSNDLLLERRVDGFRGLTVFAPAPSP